MHRNALATRGFEPFGEPGDVTLSRTINRAILERSSRPRNSGDDVRQLLADLPYAKERRLGGHRRSPATRRRARARASEVVFDSLHRRRKQTVIVASAVLLAVLAYLAFIGAIL